jgi:hypothetical protein
MAQFPAVKNGKADTKKYAEETQILQQEITSRSKDFQKNMRLFSVSFQRHLMLMM